MAANQPRRRAPIDCKPKHRALRINIQVQRRHRHANGGPDRETQQIVKRTSGGAVGAVQAAGKGADDLPGVGGGETLPATPAARINGLGATLKPAPVVVQVSTEALPTEVKLRAAIELPVGSA